MRLRYVGPPVFAEGPDGKPDIENPLPGGVPLPEGTTATKAWPLVDVEDELGERMLAKHGHGPDRQWQRASAPVESPSAPGKEG